MKKEEEKILRLRRIISDHYEIHPDEIRLLPAPQMSTSFINTTETMIDGTKIKHNFKLSGYSHIGGLRDFTQYVDVADAPYSHPTQIREIPKIEDYMFLIVDDRYITIYQDGGRSINRTVTLFKLPNFKQYWEDTVEVDVKRWMEWSRNHE